MGFLATVMVLVLVLYWLRSRARKQSVEQYSMHSFGGGQQAAQEDSASDDEITVVHRELPERLVDLRDGAERSFRVVGASHWVDRDEIWQYHIDAFFLHREQDNIHDDNAIAVYGGDRKFGYMSAGMAAQYAPLLDQVGPDFIVARCDGDLARMRFGLPRIPTLRTLINEQKIRYWRLDYAELEATALLSITLPSPGTEVTGGYPRIAGPYNNGDQVFGYYEGFATDLRAAGTPQVSSLKRSTITKAIQDVRIGDQLSLRSANNTLTVFKRGPVGQVHWKDHKDVFDGGLLEVQQVFIDIYGNVVNCGGKARPAKGVR